jgi:uncharacterized protein
MIAGPDAPNPARAIAGTNDMDDRLERLLGFFRDRGRVAVAYSGGVDSSLTLWAAAKALGEDARGVFVRSEFICGADRARAAAIGEFLARETGARIVVRDVALLGQERVRANPPERCYLCKTLVLEAVRTAAREELGVGALLAEGTNADDDPARPGRRAVAEAGALSPLAACGVNKAGVRELARLAGLPNAEDPSNSCLATRVPTGSELTFARLAAVEALEQAARDLGLFDLRARVAPGDAGDTALLQVRPQQLLFAQGLYPRLAERARFAGFAGLTIGERS